MKRFVFRLDTFLKAKKAQEDLFGLALAKAEMARRATEHRMQALMDHRSKFGERLSDPGKAVYAIRDAQTTVSFLEGLGIQIEAHQKQLRQLDFEILELRTKCEELIRERKMLENLKSRMGSVHRAKERKLEGKQSDAFSSRVMHYSPEDQSSA